MAFGDIIGYANGYRSQISGYIIEYLDTTEPVIQIPIIELNKPRAELWATPDNSHPCKWTSEMSYSKIRQYAQIVPHTTLVGLASNQDITFSVGHAGGRLFSFSKGTPNISYPRLGTYSLSVSSMQKGKRYVMNMTRNSDVNYLWGFTFGYSPEADAFFPVTWAYRYLYGTYSVGVHLPMLTNEPILIDYWPSTLDLYDPEEVPFHAASMTLGWMAGKQTAALHHHP